MSGRGSISKAVPALALALALAAPAAALPTRQETFDRFTGSWDLDLLAAPETFGDRGGPGRGSMECVAGLRDGWVDCVLDSVYEGLGRYGLEIVLFATGRDDAVGAFVTNSFGGGRLYVGRWESADELVFTDDRIDPTRAWPHQRTTYRFEDDGSIGFRIEVSKDGTAFAPHSAGTYRQRR